MDGITATLAAANLGLVFFDLSYLPLRDFFLSGDLPLVEWKVPAPRFMLAYDPMKGITRNDDTQRYLDEFDKLRLQIRDTGLKSPEAAQQVQVLQTLSLQLLAEDPFLLADRVGTLETIKNQVRGRLQESSSEEAMRRFWTVEYLATVPDPGDQTPLAWFEDSVRPRIEKSNYVRSIDQDGIFVDSFWKIDIWFQIFFATELLARTFLIKRRYTSLSWREALLWRWYDLFLLVPVFRWLRVIPVGIRLQSSGLVNMETIRSQFSRGFVATFAGELVEVIALQVINQIQSSVQRGEITTWLTTSAQREYIDLNNTNEVEVISRRLAELMVYQVLPRLQPDIAAFLHRNAELAIEKTPIYQAMVRLPGMATLPRQLTQQLVGQVSQMLTQVSQGTYNALTLDDPALGQITDQLSRHFRNAFAEALQSQETLTELQSLITDLLEEVKVNYVNRLSEEDFDELLEEVEQLKQQQAS
ncbi:hypothetical protein PROH_07965 [Prochlorothrix hollandica PCC 9006 = CALU 1027]|uniref:Uncharacterized protein n=2 Tax=Prochlorothrix hollandica TaxID=1223 RepID=A0A0M2PXG0_PROHO|nr:hypothetical protein PROH_07965 [Prochlorothrix hollandica PCC 9006 = CALU 1027]